MTGSVEEGGDQYTYPSLRKRIWTKLNDQLQWIKGYETAEDGIKGWIDPFTFINDHSDQ